MNISNTRTRRARGKQSGQGKHPAALALKWLVQDETGASVLAMAHNLMQAEQAVRSVLPPALANNCHVASIDRQCVTLAVPAAAHATRLRQLTPTLLRALKASGWNLTQIEIRVQARLAAYAPAPPPREVQP
ncbi:MAG: DciA family protein, partial [Burkholderiaceae bacterium]